MKKLMIAVLFLAIVGGASYYLATTGIFGASASKPVSTPERATAVKAAGQVIAEGKVMPIRGAALSFPAGGVLSKVFVAEGDRVEAGQVIAQLEAGRLRAAVDKAEADLLRAEARLNEVKAGARSQEIEAARASVAAAEAQLARVSAGARPEEIDAADASLAAAQAALLKVKLGTDESKLVAARADLANAEANLRQAQARYDKVAWQPDIGIRPEALQLEQATNTYAAAQARLGELMKEPGEEIVASAAAQVQRAEAELNKLKGSARPADLAAAEAEIRRASAQLGLLQAGARPETVAAAEADLAAFRAALQQSRAAVAETELRAPFAGTITALDNVAGEYVATGFVIARLADVSSWQIETQDLTELSVVRVRAGDFVAVTIDAIPGLRLSGLVSRISQYGKNRQGDVTYTVFVKLNEHEERLRSNMTAKVTIEPK